MQTEEYIEVPLFGGAKGREVVAHTTIDSADEDRVLNYRWYVSSNGYVRRHGRERDGDDKMTYLHRSLMGLRKGDKAQVDHINGDRLDNRRENLRVVSASENQSNRHSSRGRSRFRGVYWHSAGKWVARVKVNGRDMSFGLHSDELDAAKAAEAGRQEHMPTARPDPELRIALLEQERDRYRDALRDLCIFLAPNRAGLHSTLGEACGIDACILCLAEHTAREALQPST